MRHGLSRTLTGFLGLSRRLVVPALLSAVGWVGSAGCSSSTAKPDLTVTSLQSGQRYWQEFKEGYCSRDGRGDTDVVLAADADHPGGHPGVLKQVMHIRVMWRSDRDTKWEGAADTNASIRWYVFTDRAGRPEMLEYAGTGLVAVTADGDRTEVTIQKASLHPTFSHGDLSDPIGPSSFKGTVVTRADRQRVDQLLSEVRTTLAATSLPPVPLEAKTAEAKTAEAKTAEALAPVFP